MEHKELQEQVLRAYKAPTAYKAFKECWAHKAPKAQ